MPSYCRCRGSCWCRDPYDQDGAWYGGPNKCLSSESGQKLYAEEMAKEEEAKTPWKLIETGPKDGTRVWLKAGDYVESGCYEDEDYVSENLYIGAGCYDAVRIYHLAGWEGDDRFCRERSCDHDKYRGTKAVQPTHWQPFSDKPKV